MQEIRQVSEYPDSRQKLTPISFDSFSWNLMSFGGLLTKTAPSKKSVSTTASSQSPFFESSQTKPGSQAPNPDRFVPFITTNNAIVSQRFEKSRLSHVLFLNFRICSPPKDLPDFHPLGPPLPYIITTQNLTTKNSKKKLYPQRRQPQKAQLYSKMRTFRSLRQILMENAVSSQSSSPNPEWNEIPSVLTSISHSSNNLALDCKRQQSLLEDQRRIIKTKIFLRGDHDGAEPFLGQFGEIENLERLLKEGDVREAARLFLERVAAEGNGARVPASQVSGNWDDDSESEYSEYEGDDTFCSDFPDITASGNSSSVHHIEYADAADNEEDTLPAISAIFSPHTLFKFSSDFTPFEASNPNPDIPLDADLTLRTPFRPSILHTPSPSNSNANPNTNSNFRTSAEVQGQGKIWELDTGEVKYSPYMDMPLEARRSVREAPDPSPLPIPTYYSGKSTNSVTSSSSGSDDGKCGPANEPKAACESEAVSPKAQLDDTVTKIPRDSISTTAPHGPEFQYRPMPVGWCPIPFTTGMQMRMQMHIPTLDSVALGCPLIPPQIVLGDRMRISRFEDLFRGMRGKKIV